MKKAYIDEIHCKGCANELKNIFENIYGISNVSVSIEEGYVSFDGFVSERIIKESLQNTNFELIKIEKQN